jgi:hypothetical protein
MSEFSELGLTLNASDPLVKANPMSNIWRLTEKITSYAHELRREGGYSSASIKMNLNEDDINEWLQNGLGRHIEVYNPSGVMCWEGFVNDIDVKTGEDTFGVGPLLDIANRVSVTYSTIDYSTDPPTMGTRETTAVANNTVSQAKYGIWEKVVGINGATSTDATQLRNMYANDPTRCYPPTTGELALSGSGTFTITLNLMGYWSFLSAYYYANASTAAANISAKITAIVTASPNAIFSTDYSKVTANTTQVSAGSEGGQTAMTVIKDLVARGDAANTPYSVGFYNGRRLFYAAIPSSIVYQRRRGKPVTLLEADTRPWDVQPSQWIFRPDFLVGAHPPITAATLGTDPRAFLIETVKYSTPYKLSINGRKLSTLDQVLAKRGIGGMS